MKKYFLSILFFLGCMFACLTISNNKVDAAIGGTIFADSLDSRKLTITFTGLHAMTKQLKINEAKYCQFNEGEEDGCFIYTVANREEKLKITSSSYINVQLGLDYSTTVNYSFNSEEEDGLKVLFVESYDVNGDVLNSYNNLFEYELSTISQRVVINPDGNNLPMHVYDGVQYSPVRQLNININFLLEEYNSKYSKYIYVCEETNNCTSFIYGEENIVFSLTSYGDGNKVINVYLVKKDNIIDTSKKDIEKELKSKSTLITKNIYLDTIGPEINLYGGNWIYVEAGKKYTKQQSTCSDAVFSEDECVVTNDLDVVQLRYDIEKYQIVTYQAADRLGNVRTVAVNIKVEVGGNKKNDSWILYVGISAAVLLVTGIVLTYVLLKNNEKKKKISYI